MSCLSLCQEGTTLHRGFKMGTRQWSSSSLQPCSLSLWRYHTISNSEINLQYDFGSSYHFFPQQTRNISSKRDKFIVYTKSCLFSIMSFLQHIYDMASTMLQRNASNILTIAWASTTTPPYWDGTHSNSLYQDHLLLLLLPSNEWPTI